MKELKQFQSRNRTSLKKARDLQDHEALEREVYARRVDRATAELKAASRSHASSASSSASSYASSSAATKRIVTDSLGYETGTIEDDGKIRDEHGTDTGLRVDGTDHIIDDNHNPVGWVDGSGSVRRY